MTAELDLDRIRRVGKQRVELEARRDEARRVARIAIAAIESALTQALDGDELRGMSNLNTPRDGRNEEFRAVQVRGKFADAPLTESWSLVVTKRGAIVLARRSVGTGTVDVDRDGVVDFLIAEDLEHVIDRVHRAIDDHLVRAERTTSSYQRMIDLAKKFGDAFGVKFE